jgi:hypothetical protein
LGIPMNEYSMFWDMLHECWPALAWHDSVTFCDSGSIWWWHRSRQSVMSAANWMYRDVSDILRV